MKKLSILAAFALSAALILSGCNPNAEDETADGTGTTTETTATDTGSSESSDSSDSTTAGATDTSGAGSEETAVTYTLDAEWSISATAANVTTDAPEGAKVQIYTKALTSAFDLTVTEASLTYDGAAVTLAAPFVAEKKLSFENPNADTTDTVQIIEALTASGMTIEAGKTVVLKLKGTSSTDITAITKDNVIAKIVDNSKDAGWWKELSGDVTATSLTVTKN